MTNPIHYNPMPAFGLRVKLSRTAQAIAVLLDMAGPQGIERERIAPLLYMADLNARMYLGRPITNHQWRGSDLIVATHSSEAANG